MLRLDPRGVGIGGAEKPGIVDGMTKTALILSPFSSWPENAGHRRRVAQATRLLCSSGFRVTFLLYAFEDAWTHRFDQTSYDALRDQWPEVHVFHANAGVGGVPQDGVRHAIDEWWDPALGAYLDNIFSRRRFDAFVVHNVWLSRALLHASPGTLGILEMHDLFHRRADVFHRLGLRQDFFRPTEAGEAEGLSRANIVSTIHPSEQAWVQRTLPGRGRLVPYFDIGLTRQATPRSDYLERDAVRFGILASAHSLNLHGIRSLLGALRSMPEVQRKRVRLRIGGAAARFIAPDLPCDLIPEVTSEAEFYAQVDVAVVPNLDGTGFKIKIADALALGMPVLTTRHAAEGLRLGTAETAPDSHDLAERVCAIASHRPPVADLRSASEKAARRLRRESERGAARLVNVITRRRPIQRIDLTAFRPEAGILPLLLGLNHAAVESLLERVRPEIHLATEVADAVRDLMADGVTLVAAGQASRRMLPVTSVAAAFRHVAAAAGESLCVLRRPGLRHEPLCARLLWARRMIRPSQRVEGRHVLITRIDAPSTLKGLAHAADGACPVEAKPPATAGGAGIGYLHIPHRDGPALEDLAVAMATSADAPRLSLFWAAGETPAGTALARIASICGHSFVRAAGGVRGEMDVANQTR